MSSTSSSSSMNLNGITQWRLESDSQSYTINRSVTVIGSSKQLCDVYIPKTSKNEIALRHCEITQFIDDIGCSSLKIVLLNTGI